MTNRTGRPALELTIGVIGPPDVVERIMMAHASSAGAQPSTAVAAGAQGATVRVAGGLELSRRLVAAPYRAEQESADKVLRLPAAVDAFLFANGAALAHAERAGVLRRPAAAVPLGGSALFAALLRAAAQGQPEVSRVSVDLISRAEALDALAELGIPAADVHVRPDAAAPHALAAFHERLQRRGHASLAITCLESVGERLAEAGLAVLVVRPTGSAIRAGLRTATLLAAQHRLEDAQLAVLVVEVPALRESGRRALPRQAREELRLTVHRFLLPQAQRMNAAVSPAGEHAFLVTATRGSLSEASEGFRVPPFAEQARREFGVVLEVGAGLGRTARDAEAHARAALAQAAGGAPASFAFDRDGRALPPAPVSTAGGTPRKSLGVLRRLAAQLGSQDGGQVVDAEAAGALLGVTSRTARRLLHDLVEDGLAWPLPPQRSPQPGRPRQHYRLVTEKLRQDSRR